MIRQLRRKDGKLIWINLYVFAIPDHKYGGLLTFGMAFDITEKGRAQDAVQNTRAELAGSIANEINQPLAAITANANGRSGGE